MKVSRYFVWVDHCNDSNVRESGWKLRDMPHFDPAPTYRLFLMVHDILEHHPDDGSDLRYEMMAFGSSYFIRVFGKWNHFSDNWNSEHGYRTQYNDITFFLGQNDWHIAPCDEPYHPDLEDAMNRCLNWFNNAYSNDWRYSSYLAAINMSFRWISKGYRRAKERWANHSSHDVCRMFEQMEAHIEKLTKNGLSDTHTSHGDTMVVTFDTETLKFTVDHNMKKRNYTFGRICYKRAVNGILEFIENNRSPINA